MEKRTIEIPLPVAIMIAGAMLSGAWIYNSKIQTPPSPLGIGGGTEEKSALEKKVLPEAGVELPAKWGDIGAKLVSAGAIDGDKFRQTYEQRGEYSEEYERLLFGKNNGKIIINEKNAGFVLNLLWALGLSNANPILNDATEMKNPQYGGAGNFASTGGWTLAEGEAMDHYNRHIFFELTAEQQEMVDKISRGIYRPCCNNSTHFPDCNHGMAMLGLLELMASQGASESEMWKAALAVNSYWFPDSYLTIASFMQGKGVAWENVNPQEILGQDYSSGSGYRAVSSQVTAPVRSGGGSCGV